MQQSGLARAVLAKQQIQTGPNLGRHANNRVEILAVAERYVVKEEHNAQLLENENENKHCKQCNKKAFHKE